MALRRAEEIVMEELKLLVEMVATLPQMALWVIFCFFIYKTLIVGSVFGVIRLGIVKLHSWAVTPRTAYTTTKLRVSIGAITISGNEDDMYKQLLRLRGVSDGGCSYIHSSDVKWLTEAIDDRLAKDKA